MSAWRRAALERLPQYRLMIEQAESVGMLWEELWDKFVAAHRDPVDEETIRQIFNFAWWAVNDSKNADTASATVVRFFEDLPKDKDVCALLPQHMTRDEFLGFVDIFKYNLSEEKHKAFVEDFLKRRALRDRMEKTPSKAVGGTTRPEAIDILDSLPGGQIFKTPEQADEYLKKERDSWER